MTIQHGAWTGDGVTRGRRRISGSLRAVSSALARHGWRDVAKRIIGTLRSGGPTLLLHKFRQQRALVHFQAASGAGASNPLYAVNSRPVTVGGGFALREDFSLSFAEFAGFVNLWHEHPAITSLTVGAAARALTYTIVVSRHPEHGFSRLHDTLDFAGYVARRTGHEVRVAVYARADELAPEELTDAGDLAALAIVRGVDELRAAILSAGTDDLVQFLVSGDQICPVFAEVLASSNLPDFDVVLTDMYFQEVEHDVHLVMLPGIDLIHALNADYFLSRAILRAFLAAQVLDQLNQFDPYELITCALGRCTAPFVQARVRHIAFPMLRIAETRAAIEQRRLALLARASPLKLPSVARMALGRVSIVICTKNNGFLLAQLVESLERTCTANLADIVVVSNRTTDPHAAAVHRKFAAGGRIKLLAYDEPFNFSAQSNLGAAAAEGDVLLFLNDDVVPVNGDWMNELVSPLEDPAIGVVGPLLLYPDESVQHAGMYLGYNRLAGHVLRGARLPQGDCGFMATAPRQVMAVTGAALAMGRSDFESLGGFDRNLFALHIQDVDLCLRAHFSGLAVVYNPRAILLHMESVSVKPTLSDPWTAQRRTLEHAAFRRRWGGVLDRDAFMNPNIAPAAEGMRTVLRPGAPPK